jgi:hypothetical protein
VQDNAIVYSCIFKYFWLALLRPGQQASGAMDGRSTVELEAFEAAAGLEAGAGGQAGGGGAAAAEAMDVSSGDEAEALRQQLHASPVSW